MTDYSELKRLAEAATPGRNFDRLPMAGGGLKYECTGDDGTLVLKVDHKNDEWGFVGDNGQADEEFFLACTPSAVLALIAENERLAEDLGKTELRALRSIHQCSAHADLYRELLAERDQLKDENDRLRQGVAGDFDLDAWIEWAKEAAKLRAENEALRKDAELYRFVSQLAWYVDRAAQVYDIGNQSSTWSDERQAVDADEVQDAICAVMSQGEQA